MRVFVTGGTGFIGKNLVKHLVDEGHTPVCLVRAGSEKKLSSYNNKVEIIMGSIENIKGWEDNLKDIGAIINLIGIIREFPSRNITFERLHFQATVDLVDLALEKDIDRFVQMSALGASPDSRAEYHRSTCRAEDYIRKSKLRWTIIRPSLIIGPGNEAIESILKLLKSYPVVPVISSGEYRMQPIDIDDVSQAFINSLENDVSVGKTYVMGGPNRFSYNEMVDIIADSIGKKARKVWIPSGVMKLIACPFEYVKSFPLTKSMIDMLMEESITDSKTVFEDLKIEPIPFKDSLKKAIG